MTRMQVTIITSHSGRTVKKFSRNRDGSLAKQGAGEVTRGTASRVKIDDLESLAATLDALKSNEAICYGSHIRDADTVPLGTLHTISNKPDAIARARDYFIFPKQPGFLMLDIDESSIEPAALVETIRSLHPAFESADILWRASASSGIYSDDGRINAGLRGQRCYLVVADASHLSNLKQTLMSLSWFHGLARFDIGAAGQLLERGLIDATTLGQPERFDFAAPPILRDGLKREVPDAFISRGTGDGLLHLDKLTLDADTVERAEQNKATAKQAALHSPEREAIKGAYIEKESEKMAKRERISIGAARVALERRIDHAELSPYDTLVTAKGETVRVSAIIADPSRYHGRRFYDPMEPDYRGDDRIAVFYSNPNGSMILFSHAHGGKSYRIAGATTPPGTGHEHIGTGLAEDIKLLKSRAPEKRNVKAVKLASKHAWRTPWQLSPAALADAITAVSPRDINRGAVLAAINKRLSSTTRDALAAITLKKGETFTPDSFEQIADDAMADGGIVVIKAPHAAGKTFKLLKPIADSCAGGHESVVSITNRASLTTANARTLGLTDYSAAGEYDGRLSVCINSIINPRFGVWVDGADVVLVDEAAGTLRELHSRQSTHGESAPKVRAKLADMLGRARLSVLADADFSDDDLTTLREMVPGRAVRVLILPESDRNMVGEVTDEARAVNEIISAVKDGRRVMVPTDSAKTAEALGAYLSDLMPGKRITSIHSRNTTATSGRSDVQALLRDIATEAAQLDVMIYTPVVESGLSLQKLPGCPPVFDTHIAIYTGTVSPSAFNQMLLRDRDATRWLIGIAGAGTRGTTPATAAEMREMNAQVATMNEVLSGVAAGTETDFDAAVVRYAAMTERAGAKYGQALWAVLSARGWTLTRGRRADKAERKAATVALNKGVKSANKVATALVLAAPDLDSNQYKSFKERYSLSQLETAAVARYEIIKLFGRASPVEIGLYQRGKINTSLARFKLARSGSDNKRDTAQADNELTRTLRTFDAATAHACKVLFFRLGLDMTDGTSATVLTAAKVARVYRSLEQTPEGAALQRGGICRFRGDAQCFMTWLSRLLRKFGLALAKVGQTRADGRVYQIERDTKFNADTDEVTAPGFDVMNALDAGADEYLRRNTSDYKSTLSEVLRIRAKLLAALTRPQAADPTAIIRQLVAILDAETDGKGEAIA
jgi:hypothetical protein